MDFTPYQQNTLLRQLRRRMTLHRIKYLRDYAAFLKDTPGELSSLFDDLLIRTTSFFREPAVFKALKRVGYPRLLQGRSRKEPLRIWVPGCSSGEEVYSHAINVREFLEAAGWRMPVQLFATDISDAAIDQARRGFYSERAAQALGPVRVERYFVRKEHGYRVSKSIRDLCVFARHDLTQDAPFSNMDLVSCRNVLIYFNPVLQDRVTGSLHYALRPAGLLLLGGPENVGVLARRFSPADKKHKIYIKQPLPPRPSRLSSLPAQVPGGSSPQQDTANEELKTARAELQSANEELNTLNEELKHRILELTDSNNDLSNFLDAQKRGLEDVRASWQVLGKSENQLRLILDNVPALISYVDKDLKYRFVNKRHEEFFGRASESILGRTLRSLLGPKAFREAAPRVQRVLQGSSDTFESIIPSPRGYRHIRSRLMPDSDKEKKVHGFFALTQDITEHKEEERRFRIMVESSPSGILITNAKGRIELSNAMADNIFGYAQGELRGKPIEVLMAQKTRARHRWRHEEYFANPVSRRMGESGDVLGRRKNGMLFPVEVGLNPIKERGRTFVMTHIMDITERLQARQAEALQERERYQKETLDNISHNLKTPIAAIRTAAETLTERGLLEGRFGLRCLQTIQSQSERLGKQVEDLLQLSGLDFDPARGVRKRFSLSGLLRRLLHEFTHMTQDKNLSLRGRILPGISVQGNAKEIRIVVEALFDNAVLYSQQAGRVDLSLRRRGRRARITVRDTGCGIPQKDLENIFLRFYRTRRASRLCRGGSGLGLAIVKKIVLAHGGRIKVVSSLGKGSTFHIFLPLA